MVGPPMLEMSADPLHNVQESAGDILNPVWNAVLTNLGNRSASTLPPPVVDGIALPGVPPGVPTVIVPVPVVLTTPGPPPTRVLLEKGGVLAIFLVAMFIWALPLYCINSSFCCRSFQRWISRRIRCYFVIGLVANLTMLSYMMASLPDVSTNDIFFEGVHVLELLCDKMEEVLTQLSIVAGVVVALTFRKKLVALLGFDQQLIRADLKDILTCFTMSRFRVIEVSLWKVEGLPAGFSTRSLYARVVLGYNEAQHTRPHDGCTTALMPRERLQLNYDPEDDSQKLSVVIKQQEVVGAAVGQLAPVAGAVLGAVGGAAMNIGTSTGTGLGILTGIGAANSLGIEVARLDISSAVINRMRAKAKSNGSAEQVKRRALTTGPSVPWREEHFEKVDLVPQGACWLRIMDVSDETLV